MEIKYVGHSCFVIKTKGATVVTDPYQIEGVRLPKLSADIVTLSHNHSDHNNTAGIGGEPLVIDYPGEYEKQGVRIQGYLAYHDNKKGAERGENVIYKIMADGISLVHCGDLGHTLSTELLEKIGEVNVLLVPVGGVYTITAQEAASMVKDIEPTVVIPMHYNHPALPTKTFGELAPVEEFLKKIGQPDAPVEQSLVPGKEQMETATKVVVLTPYGFA